MFYPVNMRREFRFIQLAAYNLFRLFQGGGIAFVLFLQRRRDIKREIAVMTGEKIQGSRKDCDKNNKTDFDFIHRNSNSALR